MVINTEKEEKIEILPDLTEGDQSNEIKENISESKESEHKENENTSAKDDEERETFKRLVIIPKLFDNLLDEIEEEEIYRTAAGEGFAEGETLQMINELLVEKGAKRGKKCPECGRGNEKDALYCSYCGITLIEERKEIFFKKTNIWLMLLYTFITQGIYFPIWFLGRIEKINQMDKNLKISPKTIYTSLVFYILGVVFEMPENFAKLSKKGYEQSDFSAATGLGGIFSFIAAVIVLVQIFKVRKIIQNYYKIKLAGIWTFFFTVYYIQYHLNKAGEGKSVFGEESGVKKWGIPVLAIGAAVIVAGIGLSTAMVEGKSTAEKDQNAIAAIGVMRSELSMAIADLEGEEIDKGTINNIWLGGVVKSLPDKTGKVNEAYMQGIEEKYADIIVFTDPGKGYIRCGNAKSRDGKKKETVDFEYRDSGVFFTGEATDSKGIRWANY